MEEVGWGVQSLPHCCPKRKRALVRGAGGEGERFQGAWAAQRSCSWRVCALRCWGLGAAVWVIFSPKRGKGWGLTPCLWE